MLSINEKNIYGDYCYWRINIKGRGCYSNTYLDNEKEYRKKSTMIKEQGKNSRKYNRQLKRCMPYNESYPPQHDVFSQAEISFDDGSISSYITNYIAIWRTHDEAKIYHRILVDEYNKLLQIIK